MQYQYSTNLTYAAYLLSLKRRPVVRRAADKTKAAAPAPAPPIITSEEQFTALGEPVEFVISPKLTFEAPVCATPDDEDEKPDEVPPPPPASPPAAVGGKFTNKRKRAEIPDESESDDGEVVVVKPRSAKKRAVRTVAESDEEMARRLHAEMNGRASRRRG